MAKVTIVIEDLPDQMVGVSCTSEPDVAVPKNVSLDNTLAQNLAVYAVMMIESNARSVDALLDVPSEAE